MSETTSRLWLAGVGVVGLDDVAEQQRGAAVSVPELERWSMRGCALAREEREQRDEREHEQHERPVRTAAKATSRPTGASAGVDGVDGPQLRQVRRRRDRRGPRSRIHVTAKSTANWARERSEVERPGAPAGVGRPAASASTTAGPSACHELTSRSERPREVRFPRGRFGTRPSM